MVKIIIIFILCLFLFSCTKQYKYKIVGTIKVNDTLHEAIWYTDVIMFKGDTVYYTNSDNSIVEISSPYEIYINN
jgi:hypothetical protein